MTFYLTDRSTGEMKPVLEGLKTPPRYKVERMPSPRRSYYVRRRHEVDALNDTLLGLSVLVAVLALLVAFGVPSLY